MMSKEPKSAGGEQLRPGLPRFRRNDHGSSSRANSRVSRRRRTPIKSAVIGLVVAMALGLPAVDTEAAAQQTPDRLTWPPPSGWENYEPAYLSESGGYLELDPQTDYRIVAPDVVRGLVSIRGGRNVVWIGGHIRMENAAPDAVATQRRGLVISDSPSSPSVEGRVVHIEGLLIDGEDLAEGINTNAPSAIIQLQNVHVAAVRIRGADDRDGTGIYERGNHSDVVQIWGSQHELRIDGLTGASNYQGFFLEESYTGSPAAASAEVGERFLDVLGSKAAEGVTDLLDGTIGPEDCHSPIWKLRFVFLNPGMTRLFNRVIGFRNPIA